MATDADWMQLALDEARRAGEAGEVPVGAVLVKDGVLVATGRNSPVASNDPGAHAEMNALRAGGAALGNYRLQGCELFVTLEPCAMCAGAMLHARLSRVVFGAKDPKTGAAGSVVDLFAEARLNHRTSVQGGVLEAPCADILQRFFRDRREAARESSEPLGDDALRTPTERFAALTDMPFAPHYVSDLAVQRGWRMHFVDEGPRDSALACVCVHGPGEWSYFFRHLLVAPPVRVLAPDLIGFGKSDKPKREHVHRLEWHRDVLLQWLDRVHPGRAALIHSAAARPLAALLADAGPSRFACIVQAPDGGEPVAPAWRAPFPDRGYEAGLRALGPVAASSSGPDAQQASRLLREAMGYSAP
ncbi:MAG: tRNA adenosine(34) deaminase TadA [Gammaproteobacteria bacterium]|nr:tRNA adenosine(34) deaminase TadA [Gammaproteobacteria bacterium]MBU1442197.1 tRNA adenosine(34) deaminase TadA [Gammaproteobacteria bacterium]MBU2289441.1 tRNA adenosine(34) deaminase TadA [Gammaproteobacteria bacterium]MBU2408994.1 tRNA adenosine(34) deaminase TadA [Gammaproteobacteria bacterium]